jgi:hypothetical protein
MPTTRENRIAYKAYWDQDENRVTLIVDRWAGICGPADFWDVPSDASEADVVNVLREHGYVLSGDWSDTYGGKTVELTKVTP